MSEPVSQSETKEVVTPYAFTVSPHLLGKPLAGPTRRGFAIFIDIFLITVLSTISALIFAIFVALTFFRADIKLKQNAQSDNKDGWHYTRLILRGSGAIIVFFIAYLVVHGYDDGSGGMANQSDVVTQESSSQYVENANDTDIDVSTTSEPETKSIDSLVAWVEAIMSDLGLGLGWAALYFSVFTAWANGQTIGKKMCGIRVVKLDGNIPNLWESFGRYGGYGAGFATGLLGFLQLYWDPNRQAIQDKISETLVLRIQKPKKVKKSKASKRSTEEEIKEGPDLG